MLLQSIRKTIRCTMDKQLRNKVRFDFYHWKETIVKFNRFDTRNPFLSILEKNRGLFSCRIKEGLSFFRGRIFNLDEVVSNSEDFDKFIDSDEEVFQGYDADKSGAPPHELAAEGRLNCKGQSFLYTCNNPTTVIYELRPIKHERISIAEFITTRDLNFADLRKNVSAKLIDNEVLSYLISRIAEEFSRPHYSGHNYWFTQYLAGQFINMGFDGVVFQSSLHPDGDVLVFFYSEDCKAINSRLYEIDKISISYDSILRSDLI